MNYYVTSSATTKENQSITDIDFEEASDENTKKVVVYKDCKKVDNSQTAEISYKPSTSKQETVSPSPTKPSENVKYSKPLSKRVIDEYKEFYDNSKFVTGTCSVAWNLDTQKKKAFNMPTKQQRVKTQPWNYQHNMAYVLADESNLTIVDIDDAKKCRQLTKLCCQYCKYHVKTKKGFHFYFKKCTEFPKAKIESDALGFDLPALLYAPPGIYETETDTVEYKFAVASCYGGDGGVFGTVSRDLGEDDELDIVEMSQEIIDEIKRLLATKVKCTTTKVKCMTEKKVSTQKQETLAAVLPVVNQQLPFQKYREILTIIQDRNQAYEDWRNVAFALHQVSDSDEMYALFQQWSQVDYPNYDENATENLWQHCKDDQEGMITFGTLVYWAKEADPDGYKQWNNKWGLGKLKYLVNNFDQTEAAKYFYNLLPNNFVYNSNGWYMLQPSCYWKKSDEAVGFINKINDVLKEELRKLTNHYLGKLKVINEALAAHETDNDEVKVLKKKRLYCEKTNDKIREIRKKIGTVNFQEGIVKSLKGLYQNDYIEFDEKWYLIGFKNNVYDLITGEFRDYISQDYMTDENTGYDYREPTVEEYNEIKAILCQIQPDEESRKCWLSVLATGLAGKTLENFIVLNGWGGNGKSWSNEMMTAAIGKYCYVINPACLCSPLDKEGPNPELANLHNKRYVIGSEPSAGSKFNNAAIKRVTGGNNLSARKCHSNNTEIKLKLTLVCECNNKPSFRETEITDADIRRIIDLYFPSKFTMNTKLVDPSKNVYRASTELKTTEFKEKHKYAWMRILMETYKETSGELYIPESIRKRSLEYLTYSNWALQWFIDNHRQVDIPKASDFVSISAIYKELKETDIYRTLSKTEQRLFQLKSLIKMFKDNELFGESFVEDYRKQEGGKRIHSTNVLFGYTRIPDADDIPVYAKDAADPSRDD